MDVPNPRRILLVGHPGCRMLDLLTSLTGTSPSPDNNSNSLAGLSHILQLKTAYYTATIPIWLDEIPILPPAQDVEPIRSPDKTSGTVVSDGSRSNPATAWATEFLQPEAKEVLAALGALVVCFRKPSSASEQAGVRSLIEEVGRVVREGLNGGSTYGGWEGVCIAVGMRRGVPGWVNDGADGEEGSEMTSEEWDRVCMEFGFEYVDGEDSREGRNEYGELTGISRLREALEANDWAANDGPLDLDGTDDPSEEDGGFGAEAAELEMEMFGMRRAIYGDEDNEGEKEGEDGKVGGGEERGNEEDEVEKLEAMMLRMQVVRDTSAGMPEEERKRFAARAVRDMLKTL